MDESDHRSLAQRLDLFHEQDDAPGMVFWHPRGYVLYRLLEEAVRTQFTSHGYREIRTPQILRRPLWEASGHWEHFYEGMFHILDQSCEAAAKPVSCPGHLQVLKRRPPSYRELPIKLAEFGLVHRDEKGGTLHGLLRLRQFTQDDGHVFCRLEQAESEIELFCRGVGPFYASFGFKDISIAFSTRPVSRVGDDASWDVAEATLLSVLRRLEVPYQVQEGAGAFYGPKLEFALQDRLGRSWQCGTIQFDLIMPKRFDARYVDSEGKRQPLVMLHRALYGSLERFLGIVLEHHGAALPAWLAPCQVCVLPVSQTHQHWAQQVAATLQQAGLRVEADLRAESLSRRVAEAQEQAVPYLAVVGDREVEGGTVTLRERRGREAQTLLLHSVVEHLLQCCAPPVFGDCSVASSMEAA